MIRWSRTPRLLTAVASFAVLAAFPGPLREQVVSLVSHASVPVPSLQVRFTRSEQGAPVLWSSCAPVPVLVNPGPFGADADREIRAAFAEMSLLTGLRFTFAPTDRIPRADWALTVGEWETPPVLIAWVAPEETDLLGESASASTVANPRGVGAQRRIVTGAIALDATEYAEFADGAGPGRTRRNLLLHEIGHLIGLDHADGPGLMNPAITDGSPDGLHPSEASAVRAAYRGSRPGGC